MSTLSSQIANLSPEQLAKLAYELKASKASKRQEIPRREARDHFPLSFAQQRLWFVAQLEPDNPFYNCMEALRTTGKLNVPLLEQVLNEVVRRHEVLRTTFKHVAGEPVQIVSAEIKLNPRVIDLQGLPASVRERQVTKLSSEELRRPFDLSYGPLLRVVVLRISGHEHAIVFTTHHIISDGWSQELLVREIIDLYLAYIEGRPSPLPELPLQYADFAVWQRQRLTGPVLEEHLDYWKRQLTGAPQMLALPTDYPRPTELTRRGSNEVLTLDADLSHQVRALGRGRGVTLFMTLLAAFDVLLSRYSGQTDFLVGTDIANRDQGTTESLIGFFVNQLALRVDLAGDPTFSELLERVKEVTLNGHAHQEAPFEKVVDLLNPQRNLSSAPLFQVKLVLQYAPTDNLELPELTISGVEAESSIAKLDLTLIISDGDPISAVMEYSTDLFESSTISRMLAQFERLLVSAVRDPEQRISELELLSSAERHQLLVERNNTRVPYPQTRCIHELFEEQVALSPETRALTFQEQHVSYAELNGRANQLAHYLRQLGVRTETPVGVCLNRSVEMVVALLAILKAGGAYIPLDPDYPTERLAFIVDDVSLPVILTHSSVKPRHSWLVSEAASSRIQTLSLDTESELWSGLPDTDLAGGDTTGDNLAYVMYTSGSTGQPKGVAVAHRSVHNLVRGTNYVTLEESDVVAQVSNSSFDAATFEIWGALLSGARLVIIEKDVALAPQSLAAQLEEHGVTVLFLTTALFNHMARELPAAFRGLRHLLFGGEAVDPRWVREVLEKGQPRRLLHVYGPTETTTYATWHEVKSVGEQALSVPIGGPLTNVEVYVLDEHLRPVPTGVPGGLYIGGSGLARGYHKQPELTAERFVPNPFSSVGGERLYRTGDLVRWRNESALEFVGRVDTQVKIRGFRIEPGEVEAVLVQHTSVSDCAVVMRQESDGQKYLVAYVVATANRESESTFELRTYLRQRLPEFMIPAAIVRLESLPLTANGKVDRRELASWEVHLGSERPYVPPRTATEKLLCEIWQEVLRADQVGIEDNFFDLGGDSILTIQVIAKARAAGLDLTVRQLFQSQTVQELAQELEGGQESCAADTETAPFSLIAEADRAALPAGVVDAYPLTALQAGMLFHSELDPETGLYHDIFSFHLRTPFDAEALQAALQRMIDQHPVLRTSFNLSDYSEPLQLVHQDVAVPLRMEDLRGLSPLEQEEYLAQWLAAEKRHRFDWRQAPLLRFQIERRSEESFQFSFSFHHAILDGWSVATMLTELFNDYSARQTGESTSEAPLGVSFRDFVAAERATVDSEEVRDYWATKLSEATQSRLPRLEQSAGPSRVVGHDVDISGELSFALKELARTAGVPLKSILLAAHLRALNVLTGSNDVLTGIVSHGRPETSDGERVLGLFLNTLPFRQRLVGGTWLELVRETFEAERELLPFRRYPMARMQQDLGNDTPLFEVSFNFVHFHVYEELENIGGLEVLGFKGVADTNFTLSVNFSLELAGSQIGLELQYNAAELNAAQIEAVGRNYVTILESMTCRPHERYEYQCLLSPEERQEILYDWNETASPDLDSECYLGLFEAQVARTPDALAVVADAEQLTYAELNSRANQLAHYLQAAGVGLEVPVGVLLERSLDTIVVLLAIFKAGGAYVPLDPEYPDERLRFMVRDAGLELLVTHEKLSSRLADTGVKRIRVDADWPEIANESGDNLSPLASSSSLAYIIYTSGTSGTPKGVMVTHGGVINCLQWMQQRYELTEEDRFLVHTSLNFDPSVWEVFWPLMVGGRLVMAPAETLEASALLGYMAEHAVTCAYFVPSLLGVLVREAGLGEVHSLRYVISGGEKLPLGVMREFAAQSGAELHHSYGPTETAIAATEWTCVADAERVWMGRPLGNTQIYVLDLQMEPLPVGVTGELYIGGAGVGRGYAGQAALTAERFVPDPFAGKPGARLYRTGDLVRYDQDGKLEFVGRVDEQVKLRGYRIELGEIEAVLRGHQQVREVVVVMREEEGDQWLVAYVVSEAPANELSDYLRARLPHYMVPSFFVGLQELPLLPNGKINRRALPAPQSISTAEAEYEAPRTQTEELLSGLWASVLRVNRVGINENFFQLGGHSLLAMQLISRIRDTFGVELPLRELFERRTVAELAQSIDEQLRAGQEPAATLLIPTIHEAGVPLSFAQQRLWFLDRLVPESSAYSVAETLRVRGELSVAALKQSINEIMRRHEAVRTIFPEIDGNPVQVITPFRQLDLPLVDLSPLPAEMREAQAVRLASAEARRPFDLQQGPLLRVTLMRLGVTDHVVLFSWHHIISDEWSTAILAREVGALYDAFMTGTASPLPELSIQYADFALWQRPWLSGDVLASQLEYWTDKLRGVPPLLTLPTDHPRPKVQLSEGAFCASLLSAELTSELKSLAQRSKVTLFMTIAAAFHALLYRYANQATIVTGTVVANRTRAEFEPLIGFFVNTLALRSDFDDDPTFVTHLGRLRKHALEAYAHQDLPFEMLIDELQLARDLSYHPLFQVMFSWEEAAWDELTLTGLELSTVKVELRTSQFDLTLRVGEFNGRLKCSMQYNTGLFESSTISRMLAQFERLLVSAVRDPEQHISELELLSSAERHQLLVERNETQVPYPHAHCIHDLFEEQVAVAPEAPALTFQGQHVSYAELNGRANQLAHYLRQLGVNTETPVGVCLNRSIEMVVALLAISKAGGVYLPLDPDYPTERLAFILDDVSPPVILTDSFLIDDVPTVWTQAICMDTESELWSGLPVTDLAGGDITSDNLAYVMYTSGSTGNPKGVAIPHRAVVRLVKQSAYVDFGPREVFLQLAPVTFDASTLEIWGPLLNGGRLVLMPPGAPSLQDLGAVLRTEGVTVLWLTAGLFHLMVEQELEALASVNQVVAGGDVLSADHVRRLLRAKGGNGTVVNGYGPTETTTFACCHRMSGETELEHGVPIGSPIGNTQVYVLGERFELVGPGMLGELYIGGPGLARGYYYHPELTAERFVPHPFSDVGGERLYRTGDYVRWRAGGALEFVGRHDTQVKIRGYRVEPGEVETVLGRHSSVQECAVVTRHEENGEKRLVAYVVVENREQDVDGHELKEYLRERLPEFMRPSAIVAIESMPLTPNGKVDRRKLASQEVHVGGEQSYVPPRTSTEELLCGVWEEVLRVERVGIHDNFFDLGGDSILTIQVIVKARALGLELSVQQLFQHQNIYELAQALQISNESVEVPETEPFSLISEADRAALPAGVVDAYPLTALQAGMLFHSELDPETGLYHDIFSFHLELPFDGEALQAALQRMIDQHPVLRTSFNLSDYSEPLQLVHQDVAVPLRMGDLRGLPPAEQEEYLARWLAAEKRHRFDWRQAPLLRFQLERRSEESFQFAFSFHHAILDGWSVATIFTELFNDYSARQTGESTSEAPLGASFRDFVAAERATLESEEARQYWSTTLSESTQTRLPRLIEAGPVRVIARDVKLAPELVKGLKELARTAGVPLKSIFLAAHLKVLSVLSGSDDVLTGVVSHGRTETKDGERVLGLFLNTLPFRQKLSGGTWLELVQKTFQIERDSLPFRRYPMARMQQDLGSHAPLFETIFNYTHFHVYDDMQTVSGVKVLGHDGVADTNFMLAVDFSLDLKGSGIKMEMQCDAGQWSEAQLEAATRYHLTTLEEMAGTPFARYEHQNLLSKDEFRTVLFEWNVPAPDLQSECYHRLFEAQVARTPDALAAVFENEQLTYAELNSRANQLAHHLQNLGIGPEIPVGVLLERSLDTIVALLAILKAGGVFVPLDAQQPAERQQYVVNDARIAVLLTHTRFKDVLPEARRVTYIDLERQEIATQSTANVDGTIEPANLAYVIYTSGSTGRPKGVAVSHEGVVNHCVDVQKLYELTASDRALVFSSFTFDVSLEEILPTLLIGASLVVRGEDIWTPAELGQSLAKYEISVVQLSTAYWHKLTQDSVDALTSSFNVRLVVIGGEAASPETVRLWQTTPMRDVRLLNSYGPTEAIITATFLDVRISTPDMSALPTVPIGRPLPSRTTYILDSHGNPAPVGVPGELHLGGAVIARGYLHRPELTARKFIPDMFSAEPGGRLYRTGDLARYLPDGNIEFLGRIDHQVKIRGFRVEMGEIEAALKQHASVNEAVVLYEKERLIAYVQIREGQVEPSALRAYLRERLPEYMVPSVFVKIQDFPLTLSGKLDRRALPAAETFSVPEAEYEAPRTATEELLGDLWASVLRVSRVGRNDNFFELGGHSLLAIQLISRVRERFGVELPLSDLIERPTVSALAQSVENRMRLSQDPGTAPLRPAIPKGALPLSFAQQRLWFLDQLVPENTAYNMAQALRLRGELNVSALEQSINEIMRRHEAVRTTFAHVDGNPIQVITPFRHLDLPLIDLSSMSNEDREAAAVRLAGAEAQRPFDLQSGPLMRSTVLLLGPEDHVLLLCMHHIISDGWSTGILAAEVRALYGAFTSGTASPLPELTFQYGDFAVWQRQWLSGDVLARQLDYWTSKLQGVPPLLALPTDYPRPKVQLTAGAFCTHILSAELTSTLKSLAHQSGATLYMTLIAALHALLHRYAQQATIVTGTPVANRTRVETEPLIGFFVNTLVLRSDFDDDPTFVTHLMRLRKHALEAYAHQDLPFEMLVDELQLPRDLSYNPLFQVMFNWEELASDEMTLTGLEPSELGFEVETSQFDLTLNMTEVKGRLQCAMQYNTALFDASTIDRMLGHFEQLLASVAREPQQRISQLPLLSSAEQNRLLVEWNDTRVVFEVTASVAQLVEEQVRRTPDAPALVYKDERLSYSELNSRANQLARYLRRAGVSPESCVGLCLERSIEMVVATLGVLKAGGAYVSLDPAYPRERLRFMLEDAGIGVLVTQSQVQDSLKLEAGEVISLDQDEDEINQEADDDLAIAVSPENLAYVIYTSGSTGRPKGVAITHRSAVAFIQWAKDIFPPSALAGVLASTSLSFDLSVFELFVTLSAGGKVVLADNALHLPTLEAAREVTLINTVPSAMAELLRIEAVPATVQTVNLAGEALPESLVQQIYEQTRTREVWNLYGPSEDTTYSTFALIDRNQSGSIVIGRPIANTQVYICDEMLQPVPVGVAGQLLLAGEGLARGYIGRSDLTAERFLPNPFSSDGGDRMYVTGDLARYHADGQIEFLGRADSQVKLRGFRIERGEIETVLREHVFVRDAVVIATPEDGGDKHLVAYVVPAESGANVEDLRDYLRERLPEYMVPSAFVLMDAFPLTPNGKIDRRALPSPDRSTASETELTTPRDVLELQLSQIWKEVLGIEQVGVRDNFFDLGGHSLLAVRLITRIERLVGKKIPLSILFQGATVEQLARTLRQSVEKVSEQSLVTIQSEGSRPPLFLVHSASGNVMSYIALARRLGREQPVYGLQSKGLDSNRTPTARVEEMAAEYLAELIAVQPDGPYFLGGWSMGGVIAVEMARQLTALGKSVAPLVLIDSHIQTGRVKKNGLDDASLLLELAQHHGLFLDEADETFADLRSLSLDEQLEYFLEKGSQYSRFPTEISLSQLRRLFEVFKVNVHAAEKYRSRKFVPPVVLFQAADTPTEHAAETLSHWQRVADVVAVQHIPGNHYSMLTEPNVTLLAEKIKSYLSASLKAEVA